jgi:hypothetical protein
VNREKRPGAFLKLSLGPKANMERTNRFEIDAGIAEESDSE